VRNLEVDYVDEKGAVTPIEINASVIKTNMGIVVITLCRDITERRKTEKELEMNRRNLEEIVRERTRELERTQEQLVASERLAVLGRFSGNVAHEIRNPLGVMDSSAFMLEKTARRRRSKALRQISRIRNGIEKCAGIIDSILRLSRMESPVLETVNAAALLRDSLAASKSLKISPSALR